MEREFLVVLTNSVDGMDDEFNQWYSDEHLHDVLSLSGFKAAQRFEFIPSNLSSDAPYRYLAIYEVEDGRREEAEAALIDARTATDSEGQPVMPLSSTLDDDRVTWWFQPISRRLES